MDIKIGIPSLIELKSIEQNVALAKELKVDFVELNMNLLYCTPNDDLRNGMLNNPFDYTLHYYDDVDLSTPSIVKRDNLLIEVTSLCEIIKGLNVSKIIFHINPGPHMTVGSDKIYVYKDDPNYVSRTISIIQDIHNILKMYNIQMLLENIRVEEFMKPLFEALIPNKFQFVWDVGHDAKDGRQFTNIIEKYKPDIVHMHLHDMLAKHDHLLLYSGSLDINKYKEYAIKNNLSVVIEVKRNEDLIESVSRFRSGFPK
ncbi:MAG: hypothetical protein PHP65_01880 [Bacilli bacterium]|nr:hypothetical protein [Bacilli bacterium]